MRHFDHDHTVKFPVIESLETGIFNIKSFSLPVQH